MSREIKNDKDAFTFIYNDSLDKRRSELLEALKQKSDVSDKLKLLRKKKNENFPETLPKKDIVDYFRRLSEGLAVDITKTNAIEIPLQLGFNQAVIKDEKASVQYLLGYLKKTNPPENMGTPDNDEFELKVIKKVGTLFHKIVEHLLKMIASNLKSNKRRYFKAVKTFYDDLCKAPSLDLYQITASLRNIAIDVNGEFEVKILDNDDADEDEDEDLDYEDLNETDLVMNMETDEDVLETKFAKTPRQKRLIESMPLLTFSTLFEIVNDGRKESDIQAEFTILVNRTIPIAREQKDQTIKFIQSIVPHFTCDVLQDILTLYYCVLLFRNISKDDAIVRDERSIVKKVYDLTIERLKTYKVLEFNLDEIMMIEDHAIRSFTMYSDASIAMLMQNRKTYLSAELKEDPIKEKLNAMYRYSNSYKKELLKISYVPGSRAKQNDFVDVKFINSMIPYAQGDDLNLLQSVSAALTAKGLFSKSELYKIRELRSILESQFRRFQNKDVQDDKIALYRFYVCEALTAIAALHDMNDFPFCLLGEKEIKAKSISCTMSLFFDFFAPAVRDKLNSKFEKFINYPVFHGAYDFNEDEPLPKVTEDDALYTAETYIKRTEGLIKNACSIITTEEMNIKESFRQWVFLRSLVIGIGRYVSYKFNPYYNPQFLEQSSFSSTLLKREKSNSTFRIKYEDYEFENSFTCPEFVANQDIDETFEAEFTFYNSKKDKVVYEYDCLPDANFLKADSQPEDSDVIMLVENKDTNELEDPEFDDKTAARRIIDVTMEDSETALELKKVMEALAFQPNMITVTVNVKTEKVESTRAELYKYNYSFDVKIKSLFPMNAEEIEKLNQIIERHKHSWYLICCRDLFESHQSKDDENDRADVDVNYPFSTPSYATPEMDFPFAIRRMILEKNIVDKVRDNRKDVFNYILGVAVDKFEEPQVTEDLMQT